MTHSHARTRAAESPRWWQRAVPATVLAAAAGGALVTLAPSDEVQASTEREPQRYVELSLAATPDQICGAKRARMRFRVTSHLGDGAPVRWRLGVDPEGRRPAKVCARGTLDPSAGATVERTARTTAVPAKKSYDLALRIAGRPEVLRVHCDRGGDR